MSPDTLCGSEDAYEALVVPYLIAAPSADGWHLIDNADPDDVRQALEAAIDRLVRVSVVADQFRTLSIQAITSDALLAETYLRVSYRVRDALAGRGGRSPH